MNKAILVVGISATVAVGMVGGTAWGGIEGSRHDFSKRPWSGGATCGVCHTPHRDDPPKAAPLWDPTVDLTRRFGRGEQRKDVQNLGTSMCLRCHDGTVAKETIAGFARARFVNSHNPGAFSTAHDGTDHPVGVSFPLVRKGYRPMNAILAKGTVQLPNGKVECVSCHDPHNTSGAPHLLVAGNSRSALCLTCHKK